MPTKAALLLNLGSPDSTSVSDVRRYLKEFLLDPRVIDAPTPIRNLIVRGFILPFRPKKSAEAYASIWTDEGSPLIVTSVNFTRKLQEQTELPLELAMRYGSPSIPDAIDRLKAQGVDELLIIPMYPHYAMSSYETVVVKVQEELAAKAPDMRWTLLQPFYKDPDYIDALYASAQPFLEQDYDKILFSFHGVPERHLVKGDPSHSHCLKTKNCCDVCHPAHATCYRHQCFSTVKAFTQRAGIPEDKVFTSFQSRLGRDPWLTPYTDKTLEAFPAQGVKKILVMCPAFVADCLETLEEINVEGQELFREAGGESFTMIPCLNEHPAWIAMMRQRIDNWTTTRRPSV